MPNTTIVPSQQAGNRDSEASASSDFVRPPYAAALEALRALEISYGTVALDRAMRALNGDPEFVARKLDPSQVRSILSLASPGLRRELEHSLADTVRAAHPYPGTKAA